MTVKNSDILTAARRLISDPEKWAIGWLAYNRDGEEVQVDDPFACSWCAFGAAMKAAKVFGKPFSILELIGPLDVAAIEIRPEVQSMATNFRPIIILNDRFHHHDEVLRAYDLAIEAEKARESLI